MNCISKRYHSNDQLMPQNFRKVIHAIQTEKETYDEKPWHLVDIVVKSEGVDEEEH